MDDEAHEHAVASHIAYSFYENGFEAAQEELVQHLPQHSIDEELSNDQSVTLKKPLGGSIVAFRGTDPTNIYDLGADALVFLGYHRERPLPGIYTRFQAATDAYRLSRAKHGDDISTAGHSLGGTLADYVGRMHDTKAYVYNPGETPFEFARENNAAAQSSKTKVFITSVDPISISSYAHTHKEITVVPQTVGGVFGAHSRYNFLASSTKAQVKRIEPKSLHASRVLLPKFSKCELRPDLCVRGN